MWLLELLNIFYCPNITKSAPILIQLTREIIMRVFRLQNHKVTINLYIDFKDYYNHWYKYNPLYR